jgi:hypothetical protein
MDMFYEWSSILFETTEMNWYGAVISIFIHCQIFMGIIGLSVITMSIKRAVYQLENMQKDGSSAYNALELHPIVEVKTATATDTEL